MQNRNNDPVISGIYVLEQLRQAEDHLDWCDSAVAMDDLICDCKNAGEVIRELMNALRDTKANGKEIRGFFGQYRFLSNFYEAPMYRKWPSKRQPNF